MNSTPKKNVDPHTEHLPEHLLEHATETHIHDPNADRTALEIWIRSKIDGGPAAWGPWVGGILAVILGAAFLSQSGGTGKKGEAAWTQLLTATSAPEYVEIADGAEGGAAAAWASYLAGQQYYADAVTKILVDRESVDLSLKRAKDAYDKALSRAQEIKDSELAHTAELGLARTLEMQGKLTEAIESYDKIAKAAAGTAIGEKAASYAALLKKPEAKTFYQSLANYKPQPASTDPNLGFGSGLGLPPNHPSLDGPTINTPLPALPDPGDMLRDLAPPPSTSPATAKPAEPSGDALKDLAPPPASKPAAPAAASEPAKPEPPK